MNRCLFPWTFQLLKRTRQNICLGILPAATNPLACGQPAWAKRGSSVVETLVIFGMTDIVYVLPMLCHVFT